MSMDYSAHYQDLYTIGATNAGVLALLLGGSTSVFNRKQLKNTTGRVLPWLVWSYEATDGERGQMHNLAAAWYVYAPPNAEEAVLYNIAEALATAYANVFSVTWGRVTIGAPGKPFEDTALNGLQGLRVPLVGRRLG